MKALRLTAITAATAGAVALFLTVAHPGRLAAALATLPVASLLAAAGATMAGVMLGAARWRGLLAAGGTPTSVARLFAALTTGAAVNNLVPARGGDAVRVDSSLPAARCSAARAAASSGSAAASQPRSRSGASSRCAGASPVTAPGSASHC
jgi:uncharacterized membrane protein YbhN (UPF0104 family)